MMVEGEWLFPNVPVFVGDWRDLRFSSLSRIIFCFSFREVVSSSPHLQLESDAMYQKVLEIQLFVA